MKIRHTKPAIPATVLAAAVMLSITSATDVTVAAVLMNAGRQVPTRALVDAESLGQWLSRFAVAARQMRDAFAGDEITDSSFAHAAIASPFSLPALRPPCGMVLLDQSDAQHGAAAMLPALIDLPPPLR